MPIETPRMSAIEDAAGFIGIEPSRMKAAIDLYEQHMAKQQPIQRRSHKEVLAFYDGAIQAYELLLKTWPIKKYEVNSFLAMAKAMKEHASCEYPVGKVND
jgi:hypothetical protein